MKKIIPEPFDASGPSLGYYYDERRDLGIPGFDYLLEKLRGLPWIRVISWWENPKKIWDAHEIRFDLLNGCYFIVSIPDLAFESFFVANKFIEYVKEQVENGYRHGG